MTLFLKPVASVRLSPVSSLCQACRYQPYIETSCRMSLRVHQTFKDSVLAAPPLSLSLSLSFSLFLSLSLCLCLCLCLCLSLLAAPPRLRSFSFCISMALYACISSLSAFASITCSAYHRTSLFIMLHLFVSFWKTEHNTDEKKVFTKMSTGIYVQRKQVSACTSACMHACASTALFRMRARRQCRLR